MRDLPAVPTRCAAIAAFGIPTSVVDQLIGSTRSAAWHAARWVICGTDMEALAALEARWRGAVDLIIVHLPRFDASTLAAALSILENESIALSDCIWIDAGTMAPMQGRAFASFVSADDSPTAEFILSRMG